MDQLNSGSPDTPQTHRSLTALVVAHPGHELRVHHWLESTRPLVFVLTDGSGHGDRGRLDSTRRVLAAAGARAGSVFGPWTDRQAYELILGARLDAVQRVIEDIVAQLVEADVDVVASDAIEGFNPTHDLCSVIAACAVRIATRRRGRPLAHLDFLLEAAPEAGLDGRGDAQVLRLDLDDDAWQRKIACARSYPEMQAEVDRAMTAHTGRAFLTEVLRPVAADHPDRWIPAGVPHYESHGEQRVARGVYDRVLRLHEHWLPFARAIGAWAERA